MSKDKKGFILYADQKELFNQLTDEKAGELIKHIFKYVNDENPTSDDLIINLAFTPIKQQFKRDLDKWKDKKGVKSKSGQLGNLKRWYSDIYNMVISELITLEEGVEMSKSIAKDRSAINEVADRKSVV